MIVREATQADLDYVEAHQRATTRQDTLDTGRTQQTFWEIWPLKHTRRLWAMEAPDGACVAVLGICPLPDDERTGFLWMAGSEDLERWRLSLLRGSGGWMAMIYRADPWRKILAQASSRNPYSFKWATRWLGFRHTGTMDHPTDPTLKAYLLEHTPDDLRQPGPRR